MFSKLAALLCMAALAACSQDGEAALEMNSDSPPAASHSLSTDGAGGRTMDTLARKEPAELDHPSIHPYSPDCPGHDSLSARCDTTRRR